MRISWHLPVVVIVTAWLMFVVSFFLPTTDVLQASGTAPGTPLTGWQAFTSSLEVFGAAPTLLLIPGHPRLLLLLVFPFVNLVMLLSPLAALASEEAWMLSPLFILFGFLPWLLPRDLIGNLFAGFYCWDLSFFLMSMGCILASVARKQAYEAETQRLRKSAS